MKKITIGQLCKPNIGQIKLDDDRLIDYFDIASIDNINKKITGFTTYTFVEAPSRARRMIKKDNILVSTIRPNLNAVALFDMNTQNIPVASTGFCVLDCKEDTNPHFLFYYLQSRFFVNEMVSQATGASYPAVSDKIVRSAHIPVYSYDEQVVIADMLDKVTYIIAKRKQQLAKLDELVKARFVEMFASISNKVNMEDVCKIITDGTHQPPKFTTEGIPFLFVSNIITNKICYDAEKFITEEVYTELVKRTPIEMGDVLLSTVGSYGHPAVVKSERPFCFQRHIAYLKPDRDRINSEYLHSAILSDEVQRQIDERVKGIAQKTLNLSEIRKLQFPLPSIEKQNQFAAFVGQTDKSKISIKKSIEQIEILKKALMQQYFG